MKIIRWFGPSLFVLSLAASGCGDAPTSADAVDSVLVQSSGGLCAGYCMRTTTVNASLAGSHQETSFQADPAFPAKTRSFTLTTAEWQSISTRAAMALGETWQDRYGCPNCADQGTWQLEVHTKAGEIRKTVLDGDTTKNPASLWSVVDAVQSLHAETR